MFRRRSGRLLNVLNVPSIFALCLGVASREEYVLEISGPFLCYSGLSNTGAFFPNVKFHTELRIMQFMLMGRYFIKKLFDKVGDLQ